ncbi:hypothetical protein GFJ99_11575 [Flavobacterium sp. LMO6]|uniref:Uncharacterized protein n=1 Tax=Flavobacterium phage vB_FspS_laban6-1 TaxID=2686250 RepID=A0A6B9LM23_9CAUD|nr:hypothetical protein [Flavobacterium sp. LMO6]YP_009854801.1 hypothetical protein HWC90_gp03 [Flavobacterium phage vB_FspS_laban6-1]MQP63334.1 hypothetical protein [Flavobacterium sp. LMO6]QHB38974.1 hypothetical protein laban61_gp003 [Flavobacterium phage vB_FspS_laban6-1]
MSIPVNTTSFVDTPSTQAFQNWESNLPTNFFYVQTSPSGLFPAIVPLKIKDIIGTPEASGYTEFRLKAMKFYFGTTSPVDWLLVNSLLMSANITGSPTTFPISSSGLLDTLNLSIQNLALVNVGIHECRISFSIEGKTAANVWNEIYNYQHIAILNVYETEQTTWNEDNFILNHYQGTPRPEKVITINGPQWTVVTPIDFIIESLDPGVTIVTTPSSVGIQYSASGSGEKNIILKIGDYFDTSQALLNPTYNRFLMVIAGASTFVGAINFILNVLTPGDFLVNPSPLNFEATKGGTEPIAIDVFVFAQNAYSISHPSWLLVTPSQENSPSNYANLNVVPISHANLSGGTYSGNIELTSIVLGSPVTIEIPVTYVLHEFVSSPYSTTLFNFTKDPLFFEFYTQTNDTYFDIQMNVEIFDWYFQTGLSKNYVIPFKVPLYNKRQRENIGQRIDKMITRLVNPLFQDSNLYNAANVSLEITEKTYPAHEVVRNTTLNTIKFLAGVTPKNKNGNCAFLEISNATKRIAKASFDFINLLLQPGTIYNCEILRNGNLENEFQISSIVPSYLYVLDIASFEPVPGDVIEFKVFVNATDFISKKYLVFPESEYSNMILWEDEFKLVQSYEFTGKHSVKSDFTFQNSNQKRNLIDYIKGIDSKDVEKVTINSGFIPKSDIEIVKNIIKAKRVWIYISENNLVEMVNETKSMINDDVDRELNSFDLEFTINKKRHEESNSF